MTRMALNPSFLGIPHECRLRIYDYLFINQVIRIEPAILDTTHDAHTSSHIKNIPLSAQLICTCQQIYNEAHVRLYADNTFDCSLREGYSNLLHHIGRKNFSLITHLVIDWDQLEDFAWSLAKEESRQATKGLRIVELATSRRRAWGGSSFLWTEAKSYERQICQSALDIIQKHATLKLIAQAQRASGRNVDNNTPRVKWRFVPSEKEILENETVVPIAEEVARFREEQGSGISIRNAQRVIDPF